MAVPKKRMSKTKTRVRKTLWKKKADKQACKAMSKFGKINISSKKTESLKIAQPKLPGETQGIEPGSNS